MQTIRRTFACAALIALTACGGKQLMASKSAAAFQAAQKKGIPVTAGEETTTMPSEHDGMDHAAMQHGAMPGMSHGASANVDVNIEAPRSNSAIANVQPATTLRSDEFDAPATTTADAPHGKEHHQ